MAKTAAALHILVKEEKLALDLLEQIKNGADFGKLAKKHSICPSGKRGGDLGEFRQGQMVPAFSSARCWSQPARCTLSSVTTSSKCCTGNKQQGLLKEKAFVAPSPCGRGLG
jgi:peptidyl-prolyl cis-trans isomerase C